MLPRVLGSVVALFTLAICFASCYGQQQVKICEGGQCRIVQLPQAKVDPPVEIVVEDVPAFPQQTATRFVSQRTTTNRQGLFGRARLFQRLKGICCR